MKNKCLIAVVAALACVATLSAQNATLSPYSRYGYGLMSDRATSAQTGMGGVGYAMHDGRQINVMNPASYARIDSLTYLFDMGLDLSCLWMSETGSDNTRVNDNTFGGGLGYITMEFPLSKRLGMSIGLLPWSSVGYAFGNSIDNGYATRSGDGSINELYVGLGCRIAGGLSVGFNVGYLFGSTNNYSYAVNEAGGTSLYRRELSVRDYSVTAALLYVQPIGRDELSIGFTYAPPKAMLGHARTYIQNIDSDKSQTLLDDARLRHGYSMPATYGAGISYTASQRLTVEADVTYQPWADAKYDGSKGTLADRYKGALGVQYRPSLRGSYVRRIDYRAGVFYSRDYQVFTDYTTGACNNVREYGASVGVGLPIPGYKTKINFSLEWLHRQGHPDALVKENYLNITLGINFNEMWFRKSKIY